MRREGSREKQLKHQQFQLLQFPKVDYQIQERKKASQALWCLLATGLAGAVLDDQKKSR